MDDLTDNELQIHKNLENAAQIARAAEDFMTSRLGRHVIAKAREHKAEIIEQLICADPHEPKAVSDLQCKAVMLGLFEEWLNEAIRDGQVATQLLTDYQD